MKVVGLPDSARRLPMLDTQEKQRQVAALPWRRRKGRIEILLVTSRETRRWVIPKGWPMAALRDPAAAAREAYEEAGVAGEVREVAIGQFSYGKVFKSGDRNDVTVTVFSLEVTRPLRDWPEKGERQRRWFGRDEAAALVQEPGLKALISGFST
jgi:8-oxo-dGTP pyrophosphatase MutT (NUDIX family)